MGRGAGGVRANQVLLAEGNQVLRPFELTFAQYEALMLLQFSRSGQRPLGKIGQRLQVHPASVTNVIDRLEGKGFVEPPVALHDRKNELRDQHRSLVGSVSRKTGVDHRKLNAELIKRTGGRVEQATVAQLARRIALLEKWRDSGFDGGRA